ncbi:HAD family hydrolase [Microbacterium maritypicum]
MPLRLIATDLDGTLLTSEVEVSGRTRAALDAARARGVHVVPVTARQPIGLRAIAGGAGFDGWALCSNGAFATHLTDGRMVFAEELPSDTIRTLAAALRESIPDLLFASVRDGGEGFVAQHGYASIADLTDHKRDPRTMGGVDLEHVLAAPSLKLVIRHPELAPVVVFDALRALGLTGFEATLLRRPVRRGHGRGRHEGHGARTPMRAPRHRSHGRRRLRRCAQRRRDAALGGPRRRDGERRGRRERRRRRDYGVERRRRGGAGDRADAGLTRLDVGQSSKVSTCGARSVRP